MNLQKIALFIFLNLLILQGTKASCTSNDSDRNMCAGHGFCTYYPLGEQGQECGQEWSVPKNWVAMNTNCLSEVKTQGTFSCANKGVINVLICGKSNCYKCICQ